MKQFGHRALALAFIVALACGGNAPEPAPPEPESDDSAENLTGPHRASTPPIDGAGDSDDGLEVEGVRGRLEVYDIQQGVKPHVRALTRCFTSNVGRRRYIGGDVELAFVVGKDGRVKSVHFAKNDLGAWAVEKCMLEVCRGMTFVPPKGGPEADFTWPLSLDARSRVNYWDEPTTRAEVAGVAAELDACAAESGAPRPRAVWITLYVGTRGQVKSAGFASPRGPMDDAWAACAEGKIRAWTLTDPRGRVAKAGFTYPLD